MTRVFRAFDTQNGLNGGAFVADVLDGTGNVTEARTDTIYCPDDSGVYQPFTSGVVGEYYFNGEWWIYAGPALTTDFLESSDPNTAEWVRIGVTLTQNVTDLLGNANTAYLIEATSSTANRFGATNPPTPQSTNGVVMRVFIRKSVSTSVNALIQPKQNHFSQFNPQTGAFISNTGTAVYDSVDHGDILEVLVEVPSGTSAPHEADMFPDRSGDNNKGIGFLQAEWHENKTIAEVRGTTPVFTAASAASVGASDMSFNIANHADNQGGYFVQTTVLQDNNLLAGLGNGRVVRVGASDSASMAAALRANNSNSTFSDPNTSLVSGPNLGNWLADAQIDIGTAYETAAGGNCRVNQDGTWGSAVIGYTGYSPGAAMQVFTTSGNWPFLVRNIRRYDLNYTAAQSKIDDLMAGIEDSDLVSSTGNRPTDKNTALGGPGNTDDLEIAFLQANGATSDNINTAYQQFLTARGFITGNYNDDMFAYLGGKGYTGSLPDRLQQWWAAGAPV